MTVSKNHYRKVFISYSHQDERWLKRLHRHLKPLERDFGFDIWDDTKINAGSKWRRDIKKAIKSAKVALCLVSADFLASDFIMKDELPPLLAAAKKGGKTILSIIVSPCRFEETKSLSQFQALNSPSKTLEDMTTAQREKLFVKVTKEIEVALKKS